MYVHVGVHRGTCYTCTYYVPQRGGRTGLYELCGLLVTDKNVYIYYVSQCQTTCTWDLTAVYGHFINTELDNKLTIGC